MESRVGSLGGLSRSEAWSQPLHNRPPSLYSPRQHWAPRLAELEEMWMSRYPTTLTEVIDRVLVEEQEHIGRLCRLAGAA